MAKRREESFFGMHFDFHAGRDQTGIGSNCDPALIGRMLEAVQPDYVQCDTKGHAGASSYPTKVGNPAKGIEADILRMWREETSKRRIALYAHHSGVWDNLAIERHPDWAACGQDGQPSKEKTSVFGPYADELLIPQLIELANLYGLDGAWVDGECWAQMVDYSAAAQRAYEAETQRKTPKEGEPGYDEYLEFNRQGFRRYLAHYISEVKKAAPHFQIASNWLYTSFVPEEKTIPVDFISGDYSPSDSVNTARVEAYCLMNQPQPWDLMAWGFNIQDGYHCVKELRQLCQEAAVVISVGGGFQFYNRQLVGTVQEWAIPMWAELAKFCRAREALCHRAKTVPQVALIHSTKAFYHNKRNLFTPYGCKLTEDLKGSLFAVLDNQYSAEILMTHHTDRDLSAYGMIIVPNVTAIEETLKQRLLDYAAAGGIVVISGGNAMKLFEDELGVSIKDSEPQERILHLSENGQRAPAKVRCVEAEAVTAVPAAYALTDDAEDASKLPVLFRRQIGRGLLFGVAFDLGRTYLSAQSAVLRRFAGRILSAFTTPAVRVYGSSLVQVALCEKDGQRRVNLLNLAGAHADTKVRSFDEIPPLCDLTVTLATEKTPSKVTMEPEGEKLKFYHTGGLLHISVPKLDIHAVITVE